MSSLTLTLIQSQLHWENKQLNLAMFEEKIAAIQEKTEVVILPEMFSTGFSMQPKLFAETMDGSTVKWMQKIANKKRIILTGSLIIKDNEKYYNRLIWMLPNGEYGYYDKRHLFAFGEEDKHYTAGYERLIASVKGWKLNLQICYDLRFPIWSRQSPYVREKEGRRLEYDVLIYIANWPESRSHAWKTLLQARGIENQCYVVGVNRVGNDGNNIYYSGDSMVVSGLGKIIYHKPNDEDAFTITLQKDDLEEARNKYPFWKDADRFKIISRDN